MIRKYTYIIIEFITNIIYSQVVEFVFSEAKFNMLYTYIINKIKAR